jgi:hypothetical protein
VTRSAREGGKSAGFAAALVLIAAHAGAAQQASSATGQPISDNSFLIEEAYNQDPGMVQHISTFTRPTAGGWNYNFTQEWPVRGMRHQFSYSVLLVRGASPGETGGLGDIGLNYRYQLLGRSSDDTLLMAPRFTVLLPTGSRAEERGNGGLGLQVNLPLTWKPRGWLATHWNAGTTIVPRARFTGAPSATAVSFNLGASVIWLANDRINLLIESVWASAAQVQPDGTTTRAGTTLVSPGVRVAFDFKDGLQVVPGAAYAIGVGSRGANALIVYLSFEHPFRREH